MTPRAFRSFTILCFCMTLLFGALGAWQIHRLQWKKELLAQIHQGQQETIQKSTHQKDIQKLPNDKAEWQEWRHYLLSGKWVPEKAKIVQPRIRKGIPGGHLFIPILFHTPAPKADLNTPEKPSKETTLWINLGWISAPFPAKPQKKFHASTLPEPKIVIRLRKVRPPHWATPDNRPEKNEWFWPDFARWSDGTPVLFYGELSSQGTADIYPDVLIVQIPNRHLEYSITWLSFVVIVIGLWLYMYRKRLG